MKTSKPPTPRNDLLALESKLRLYCADLFWSSSGRSIPSLMQKKKSYSNKQNTYLYQNILQLLTFQKQQLDRTALRPQSPKSSSKQSTPRFFLICWSHAWRHSEPIQEEPEYDDQFEEEEIEDNSQITNYTYAEEEDEPPAVTTITSKTIGRRTEKNCIIFWSVEPINKTQQAEIVALKNQVKGLKQQLQASEATKREQELKIIEYQSKLKEISDSSSSVQHSNQTLQVHIDTGCAYGRQNWIRWLRRWKNIQNEGNFWNSKWLLHRRKWKQCWKKRKQWTVNELQENQSSIAWYLHWPRQA